jgi:WhiB family redox-sensing transcriptional regulator
MTTTLIARAPAAAAGFTATPIAWEPFAACAGQPAAMVDLFFSDEPRDITRAKAVCAECSVSAECLEAALDRSEQFGVWGGQLFIDGRVHLSKRGRGRPPSTARPSDLIPLIEVPVHLRARVEAITEIGNGFLAEGASIHSAA